MPFESSASLVNLLTATRIRRKGFDTHFVLFGPGSLVAAATRGYPKVGDEGFPGNMNYNNLLRRFMDEGGQAYACRFSAAALYGMREIDMMEGVKPINPRDVLDAAIMRLAGRRAHPEHLDDVTHNRGRGQARRTRACPAAWRPGSGGSEGKE